jgi:FixJ family two-component response regulator
MKAGAIDFLGKPCRHSIAHLVRISERLQTHPRGAGLDLDR